MPLGINQFILENDTHAPTRRRNSISHELSHLLREHPFQEVLLTTDGCRAFSRELGELLIPHDATLRAAGLNWDDAQVAQYYNVSVPLARMRMNCSGARKVIANRRLFWHRFAG